MELYSGPIIDTHHHLWRRKDLGWLNPPLTPKMFGDFFGLCRDFPIEEWKHDIGPHNVVKTVHVTANWAGTKATRGLDETRWLARAAGTYLTASSRADLTETDVESTSKALQVSG
jgi:predicted TIM-barrel fold metal-dependent hydrolase